MTAFDTRKPCGVSRPAAILLFRKSVARALFEHCLGVPRVLPERREVEPPRGAQGKHDAFFFALAFRRACAFGKVLLTLDVSIQVARVGEAPPAEVRMRARTEAQILLHRPVFEVVARLAPGRAKFEISYCA